MSATRVKNWKPIEANPSLLYIECADDIYNRARMLPKFTNLSTTSNLDVMQGYADAHNLSLVLAAIPRELRFGEIVRALFRDVHGPTPSIELLATFDWLCNIEITLGPHLTVNSIYQTAGVALKKWIRNNISNASKVITLHEYFERTKWIRIDGRNVLVQVKCNEDNVESDWIGNIRIRCTDSVVNLAKTKQQVRDHLSKIKEN